MSEAELYSQYRGLCVPAQVCSAESLQQFEEMSFRADDVLIAAYPKSGSMWMHELVCHIMSGGELDSVRKTPTSTRVPWIDTVGNTRLLHRPSPRIMATHFPLHLMPRGFSQGKPKVICVIRNPKDVCTSHYHYHLMAPYLVSPSSKSDFVHKFLQGKVIFGSWFSHVKSWLSAEDKERIMIICYEEMIEDLKAAVRRISTFLEQHLEEELVEQIADRCVFESMKKNDMANQSTAPPHIMDQSKGNFMRKGVSGDWKNFLTVAEAEHFNAVYKEEMNDVGFTLNY